MTAVFFSFMCALVQNLLENSELFKCFMYSFGFSIFRDLELDLRGLLEYIIQSK